MDQSSPNKSAISLSIFDLLELDGDEDDDEYNPADEEEVEDEEEEEIIEDLFMGDPQQASETSDIEMNEGDTIARRTRSKLQIEEEPKDTLEFPDVTEDLYEPAKTDDDEWLQFLNSLYQDNPSKIFDEDEAKDPDYSVFDDVDGLADNRQIYNQQISLPIEPVEKIDISLLSSNDLFEWSKFFTKENIELLYHQMAQHIQLLTQQYLLTMTSQTLGFVAETASFLIKEINQFAAGKEVSIFRPPNLLGALKILENNPINPSDITVTAHSWRQCPVPLIIRPIFAANPTVFRYHHLLPRNGYPDITVGADKKTKTKTKFTQAEDHLIALGLEQFQDLDKKNCYQHIRQLLLPVKSEEQIRMHVKNKRRHLKENSTDKCDDINPITYYLKHGKLMEIQKTIPQPKETYSHLNELPEWLAKHLEPKYSSSDNNCKRLPRLKLSPHKGIYSLKYQSSGPSPTKSTSVILRKYRYLTKLPYIRPKPSPNQAANQLSREISVNPLPGNPEITVINIENPSTMLTIPSKLVTPSSLITSPPPIVITTASSQAQINEKSEEKIELDTSEVIAKVSSCDVTPKSCESPEDPLDRDVGNPENGGEKENQIIQNEDDDESDLAALMVASSTITSNKGRNKSHDAGGGGLGKKEAKKSQTTKHKESTVLLLSDDWLLNDYSREQKEQIMVQCFMSKVREALKSDEDYLQFLTYLSDFGKSRYQKGSIKELHHKTEKLLIKVNAQQVMEEFVLLLNASEAQECGKMYQYLHWRRYLSFIRKMEVYSLIEPNCIPRLHKTLVQLKSSDSPVNKKRLKAAVGKAISGHPYLMNEFSSLFLDEKPKDYLFASDEDFDNLVITGGQDTLSELLSKDEEVFENVPIDLSSEERKYGTNECPCKNCHSNNNLTTQSESEQTGDKRPQPVNATVRHCVACSLKFIGGKIYLQGPKKIQPAEVQYINRTSTMTTNNQLESTAKSIQSQSTTTVLSQSSINPDETNNQVESTVSNKPWSMADDKLLLELCKAKVSKDDEANFVELFQEIASKLNRPCDNVIERFNKLMEMFKSEAKIRPEVGEKTDLRENNAMEVVSEGVT